MWTKFGDDWSKIATCIADTFSFKHEYRRHTLTLRCDVIGEVIVILVDDLHNLSIPVSNSGYIENYEIFKTDENLRSGRTFSS